MGKADGIIRILAAIIIAILYLTNTISGTAGILLLALAIVFLVTGFFNRCPLYLPFHINTIKNNKTK